MDDNLFEARVNDTAELCLRTSSPKFLGFLSPTQAAKAQSILCRSEVNHNFFGGYDTAERTMLCCYPDWCEDPVFPIQPLTLLFRRCDILSHRDFLGALMGLGITRESIGDILCEDGRAVIFANSDIANYISTQLSKVGRCGISIKSGFSLPLPLPGKKVLCTDTLASARLDCTIAAICGISRNEATRLIESGFVAVNSIGCEKTTRSIADGDRITVRTKGRFDIESTADRSRKGRIILKYSKYI